jgi:hypothetical protein
VSAGNASLLFIVGGEGANEIVNLGSKIRLQGSTDLWRLIDREPHDRLHVARNIFRQGRRADLKGYRTLLNMITEPEGNERVLENLRKLLRGVPGKIVNPPDAVLRSARDHVARRLAGTEGLIVPSVVRLRGGKPDVAVRALAKAGIEPPVIVRQTGTHGGRIVGCFDAVEAALGALEPSREYLATQFVDFRSPDGLFRKYRVFFIGEQIILRHRLVSDDWNVHARARKEYMSIRPELIAEEQALFEGGDPFPTKVRRVLEAVRDRLPLDYFGMDFGVTPSGQVVLFEANATMSFFPFSPDPDFAYLKQCFRPAQRAFRELLGLPAEKPAPLRMQVQPAA